MNQAKRMRAQEALESRQKRALTYPTQTHTKALRMPVTALLGHLSRLKAHISRSAATAAAVAGTIGVLASAAPAAAQFTWQRPPVLGAADAAREASDGLRPDTVGPLTICAPGYFGLDECLDPAFLQTPCAQDNWDRLETICGEEVLEAQDALYADAPEVTLLRLDDETTTPGVLIRAEPPLMQPGSRALAALEQQAAPNTFDTNCSVQSCEEYVYEKYYDYEKFRRANLAFGDDVEGAFWHIYGAEGIAGVTLKDITGRHALPDYVHRSHPRKNVYLAAGARSPAVDWLTVAALGGFDGAAITLDTLADYQLRCRFDNTTRLMTCGAAATDAQRADIALINGALSGWDATVRDRQLRAEGTSLPPDGVDVFDWHRTQAETHGSDGFDRVLTMQRRMRLFESLLQRRQTHVDAIERHMLVLVGMIGLDGGSPAEIAARQAAMQDSITAYSVVSAAIAAELDRALELGCMELDEITACDWSPEWLVSDMRDQFLSRQRDYEACMERTSDAFQYVGPSPDGGRHWLQEQTDNDPPGAFCSPHLQAARGRCGYRSDYARNWRTVEDFFATTNRWQRALDLPLDPTTGRPILTASAGDAHVMGNSTFGVNLDYGFTWDTLPEMHTTADGQSRDDSVDVCDMGIAVSGHARVSVTAFGHDVPSLVPGVSSRDGLMRVDVLSAREDDDVVGHVSMTVLGNDVFVDGASEAGPSSTRFHLVQTVSNVTEGHDASFTKEKTVWVGPVPFTFRGGVAGEVGLNLGAEGTLKTCSSEGANDLEQTAAVRIEPFATLDAFGTGLVGVPGLALGLRTDLVIADARLPFTANASLDLPDDTYQVDLELPAQLTLLKGAVSLQAEALVKTWRKRLFGWRGFVFKDMLYERHYTLPIGFLMGSADPGPPAVGPAHWSTGRACQIPASLDAPLRHVRFDDATRSGDDFVDSVSAAVLAATAPGTTGLSGVHGQSVDLTGAAYDSPRATGRADRTWSVWVKAPTDATDGPVLRIADVQDAHVELRLHQGEPALYALCGATRGRFTGTDVLDGAWHMWSLQRTGDTLSMWLDGDKQWDITQDCGPLHNAPIGVGGTEGVPSATVHIDELVVYDEQLSAAEMRELFARGNTGRPAHGDGAAAPAPATGLQLTTGVRSLHASWINPPSLAEPGVGFDEVRLLARKGRVPTNWNDTHRVTRDPAGDKAALHRVEPGERWAFRLASRAASDTAGDSVVLGPVVWATGVEHPLEAVTDLVAHPFKNTIRLSWGAPPTTLIRGYSVVARPGTTAPQDVSDGTPLYVGSGQSVVHTSLGSHDTWSYAVWPRDAYGQVGPAATVTATRTTETSIDVPTPTDLSWTGSTLLWDHGNAAQVAHYEIAIRAALGAGRVRMATATGNAYRPTGLDGGRTYIAGVRAIGKNGTPSAWVSMQITSSVQRPNTVRGLVATREADGVHLTWQAPDNARYPTYHVRAMAGTANNATQGREVYTGAQRTVLDPASDPAIDPALAATGTTYTVFAETNSFGGGVSVFVPPADVPVPANAEHRVLFGESEIRIRPPADAVAGAEWTQVHGPNRGRTLTHSFDGVLRVRGENDRSTQHYTVPLTGGDVHTLVVDTFPTPVGLPDRTSPLAASAVRQTVPAAEYWGPHALDDYDVFFEYHRDPYTSSAQNVVIVERTSGQATFLFNPGYSALRTVQGDENRLVFENGTVFDVAGYMEDRDLGTARLNPSGPGTANLRHVRRGWAVSGDPSTGEVVRARWDGTNYVPNGSVTLFEDVVGAWSLGDGRVAVLHTNSDSVHSFSVYDGAEAPDTVLTVELSAEIPDAFDGVDLAALGTHTFARDGLTASTADAHHVGIRVRYPAVHVLIDTATGTAARTALDCEGTLTSPTTLRCNAPLRTHGESAELPWWGSAPRVRGPVAAWTADTAWLTAPGRLLRVDRAAERGVFAERTVPGLVLDVQGADGHLAVLSWGTGASPTGTVTRFETGSDTGATAPTTGAVINARASSYSRCFALTGALLTVVEHEGVTVASQAHLRQYTAAGTAVPEHMTALPQCRAMDTADGRVFMLDEAGFVHELSVDETGVTVLQTSAVPVQGGEGSVVDSSRVTGWDLEYDPVSRYVVAMMPTHEKWTMLDADDLSLVWAKSDPPSRPSFRDYRWMYYEDGRVHLIEDDGWHKMRTIDAYGPGPNAPIAQRPRLPGDRGMQPRSIDTLEGVGTVFGHVDGIDVIRGGHVVFSTRTPGDTPTAVDLSRPRVYPTLDAVAGRHHAAFDGTTLWFDDSRGETGTIHGVPWPFLSVTGTPAAAPSGAYAVHAGEEVVFDVAGPTGVGTLETACDAPAGMGCTVDGSTVVLTAGGPGVFDVQLSVSNLDMLAVEHVLIEVLP